MQRIGLLLVLASCGGEPDPTPLSWNWPVSPRPDTADDAQLSLFTTVVDSDGMEVEVRLDLPPGAPPPLYVLVPGLGPSFTGAAASFQVRRRYWLPNPGPVGFLTIGKPGCSATANFCEADAYRRATRPAIREHVHLAVEWATSLGVVSAEERVLLGQATAAPDALALASVVDADTVVWDHPVVQGMGDYLEDQLLRRVFWTRWSWADRDCDGAVNPEEWGFYRGSQEPSAPAFAGIDRNGDGLYTVEDNEIAGAADWTELQAIVEAEDEEAWTTFWGGGPPHDQRFPSVAWARASWTPPPIEDWLLQGDVRVEVVDYGHVAAPPEPVFAVLEAHPERFTLPPEQGATAPCGLSIMELGQQL